MMSTAWQDFNQTSLVLQIIPNVSNCTKIILKEVKNVFCIFRDAYQSIFELKCRIFVFSKAKR